MNRLRYSIWITAVWLVAGLSAGAAERVLTQLAEVRALSNAEAALGVPVRVRGVITWARLSDNTFFIQDDAAGVSVRLDMMQAAVQRKAVEAMMAPLLKETETGMSLEVEVIGRSKSGGFAPVVELGTMKVLGPKPLPAARPMVPARFFSGADACERVEAGGVVQGFHRWADGWRLDVDANPGSFVAEVPETILKDPAKLVDAEVRLRGVAATRFNLRQEVIGVRLIVTQPQDLIVEKPAPRSPFDAPEVSLDQLLPFRPQPLGPHRQLVQGTVTYVQSGRRYYIQNGDRAVRVELLSPVTLTAGDRVQVSGFPEMSRQVAGLTGALVRKLGSGGVPAALSVNPAEILARNAQAARESKPAEPHDFDGHLITFRCRLLDVQRIQQGRMPQYLLTVATGGQRVEAVLDQNGSVSSDDLQVGSELQLTGIVQLEYSAYQAEPGFVSESSVGMKVLLRGAEDLVVLKRPPWWSARRLLGALALGAVALGASMLWAWQLRRQLHRKSTLLAAEMHARRDAAIEFQATLRERNRLAANLHDTLLQNITGLNYQLEACEAESLPRTERTANHLETARKMVQRAQEDLRGTVWALRVLPLQQRSFGEALRALADQLAEGRDTRINIRIEGELPHLSEFVAGNLLLVIQEAIHNALKHARPNSIEVAVSAAADRKHILLVVRDDGLGFDLQSPRAPEAGHFGLAGMRERVGRLGGTLRIESRPGQGTSVHAEVRLGSFDEDLA